MKGIDFWDKVRNHTKEYNIEKGRREKCKSPPYNPERVKYTIGVQIYF